MPKQIFTTIAGLWLRVRSHYFGHRPFWLGSVYGLLAILIATQFGAPLRGWLLERLPESLPRQTVAIRRIYIAENTDLSNDLYLAPVPFHLETPILQPEVLEEASPSAETASSIPSLNNFIDHVIPLQPGLSSFSSLNESRLSAASSAASLHEAAPLSEQSSAAGQSSSVQPQIPLLNPTTDFPALGNAVHPVTRVPNWGAMTTPAQWERRHEQMKDADFVPIPRYNLAVLTEPMETYVADRENHTAEITAKLYYSTRHMGRYDLDAGEYAGTHAGVDLKLAAGTPVGAVAGGRVHAVGNDDSLGLYIVLEHRHPTDGLFFSLYGHFETVFVQTGDNLTAGQAIGRVGLTGQTTAPHLHLQIDRDTGQRPHVRYKPSGASSYAEADRYTMSPIEFIGKY